MLDAVIFDMDGLLIDSEPIWRRAEIRVFAEHGVALTEELCAQTMGLRLDEVVRYWRRRFPWEGCADSAVVEQILVEMERELAASIEPLPGVRKTVQFFRSLGLRLGLATSSHLRLVKVVLPALGLQDAFEVVHSAEFEARGKPAPDVFLTTAEKLGVRPDQCLVFEDSPNGVRAALAAGMRCVAVPEPMFSSNEAIARADLLLGSLEEFSPQHWRALSAG